LSFGNSTLDIRNNIFDGFGTMSLSAACNGSSCYARSNSAAGSITKEDYNNIGGAQGSPGFAFNGSAVKGLHDLTNRNPLYISAGATPPNFDLRAGSPCLNAGLSGLTSGNVNIGAY
jgi:hypothetical protein